MFGIPVDRDVVTRISASDLQDGDVLLYHGTSLLSRLIREFDGSQYSHSAIVHNGRVVEALGNGISVQEVSTSIGGAKYVDVYRFTKDGHKLRDPEFPVAPLDAAVSAFEADPERYAYDRYFCLRCSVLSKLKCPLFVASEMSGLVNLQQPPELWESGNRAAISKAAEPPSFPQLSAPQFLFAPWPRPGR